MTTLKITQTYQNKTKHGVYINSPYLEAHLQFQYSPINSISGLHLSVKAVPRTWFYQFLSHCINIVNCHHRWGCNEVI